MAATKAVSARDMNNLKITNLGAGAVAADAVNKNQMDTADTAGLSRANHTGSQLAATISDFVTQVRLNTLNQMAAPTVDLSMASRKLTNVLDPTVAQDAATKSYVDTSISTFSGGLVFKGKVRAGTVVQTSVTSAPATVDGVTPATGDVFLLMGQTVGSENGPWVWNGAAVAMTRATNWNTTALASPGSLWVVQQGTYDNQLAIMSNDAFVLGTDTATFVFLNPAAAADNDIGYTTTSPVVSAGAVWTVTHNLNSKAITVAVYRTASPFDEVGAYITRDTVNAIGIAPDIAMASGEYTVVVQKVI